MCALHSRESDWHSVYPDTVVFNPPGCGEGEIIFSSFFPVPCAQYYSLLRLLLILFSHGDPTISATTILLYTHEESWKRVTWNLTFFPKAKKSSLFYSCDYAERQNTNCYRDISSSNFKKMTLYFCPQTGEGGLKFALSLWCGCHRVNGHCVTS